MRRPTAYIVQSGAPERVLYSGVGLSLEANKTYSGPHMPLTWRDPNTPWRASATRLGIWRHYQKPDLCGVERPRIVIS